MASYAFVLFRNRGHQDEITSSKSNTVRSAGLNHGDIIYLEPLNGAIIFENLDENSLSEDTNVYTKSITSNSRSSSIGNSSNGFPNSSMNIVFPNNQIVEDDVDQQLWKSDGKIKRQRDPKL